MWTENMKKSADQHKNTQQNTVYNYRFWQNPRKYWTLILCQYHTIFKISKRVAWSFIHHVFIWTMRLYIYIFQTNPRLNARHRRSLQPHDARSVGDDHHDLRRTRGFLGLLHQGLQVCSCQTHIRLITDSTGTCDQGTELINAHAPLPEIRTATLVLLRVACSPWRAPFSRALVSGERPGLSFKLCSRFLMTTASAPVNSTPRYMFLRLYQSRTPPV